MELRQIWLPFIRRHLVMIHNHTANFYQHIPAVVIAHLFFVLLYGFHTTPDDGGYRDAIASGISGGLSIVADNGILPLQTNSMVLTIFSSAEFFHHTRV
jgi:hypothetical protein